MTGPSPAERLRELDERKMSVHLEFSKLDVALAAGSISPEEYRYFVSKAYGGKLEHEALREIESEQRDIRAQLHEARGRQHGLSAAAVFATLAAVLFIGSLVTFLLGGGASLTGFVALDSASESLQLDQTFVAPGQVVLNVTNITSLRVSGSLTGGAANISLVIGAERLVVYSGSSASAMVATDKESYALGEPVLFTLNPIADDATVWLTTPAGERVLVASGFLTPVAGEYALDALVNTSGTIAKLSTSFFVRDDTDSSKDIVRSAPAETVVFSDACVDTCSFVPTGDVPLSLDVAVAQGASLTLTQVQVTGPRANSPPRQTAAIPDVTVSAGESVVLDLSSYFADDDDEALTFDVLNAPGAVLRVDGASLTITGVSPGSSQSAVYASDAISLVQSNLFAVTVLAPERTNTTENETGLHTASEAINTTTGTPPEPNMTASESGANNATTNETVVPETDVTASPPSSNASSDTADQTIPTDCSEPDPNRRPLECLNGSEFFQDQTILITTTGRTPIARLTPIGNLLLSGGVHEMESFTAEPEDYLITFEDAYGVQRVSIWFESATGDLHLAGALHEENANLEPAPGSFVLRNRKGITLAWANAATGDLYVRGNVIPYRRDIMK
jgi:hypothetical protein